MVRKVSEHTKQINDIQLSKDMNMLITASKDSTAKVSRFVFFFFFFFSYSLLLSLFSLKFSLKLYIAYITINR